MGKNSQRGKFKRRFAEIDDATSEAPVHRAQETGSDYSAQVHTGRNADVSASEKARLQKEYGEWQKEEAVKQKERVSEEAAEQKRLGGRKSLGGGMYQYPDGTIKNY